MKNFDSLVALSPLKNPKPAKASTLKPINKVIDFVDIITERIQEPMPIFTTLAPASNNINTTQLNELKISSHEIITQTNKLSSLETDLLTIPKSTTTTEVSKISILETNSINFATTSKEINNISSLETDDLKNSIKSTNQINENPKTSKLLSTSKIFTTSIISLDATIITTTKALTYLQSIITSSMIVPITTKFTEIITSLEISKPDIVFPSSTLKTLNLIQTTTPRPITVPASSSEQGTLTLTSIFEPKLTKTTISLTTTKLATTTPIISHTTINSTIITSTTSFITTKSTLLPKTTTQSILGAMRFISSLAETSTLTSKLETNSIKSVKTFIKPLIVYRQGLEFNLTADVFENKNIYQNFTENLKEKVRF